MMVKKFIFSILSLMVTVAISANPQDSVLNITKEDCKNFLIGAGFGATHGAINALLTPKITDARTRDLFPYVTGATAMLATNKYICTYARPYQLNASEYPFGGEIVQPGTAVKFGHGIAQGLVEGSYNPRTQRFDRIGFSFNLSQLAAVYSWFNTKIHNYCHKSATQTWVANESQIVKQAPEFSWIFNYLRDSNIEPASK